MTQPRAARIALGLAAVLTLAVAASGCGEAQPTFTAEEATAEILEQFPDAEVTISAARIDEQGRGVADADFNGQVVSFFFQPADDAWELEAVDFDGSFYYIRDLEQISATMLSMGELAGALGRYEAANQSFPEGESIEALRALVPEFIPDDHLLQDAWDRDLEYESDGDDYTLISYGADQQSGTADDIILHTGAFVGAGGGQGQQ